MSGTFEAGSITGKVDLDNEPAVKALRALPAEAKDMKIKVEKELKDAGKGGAEAFLKELKGEVGRRSVFGETFELLKGGGAAIGLSMAGEVIKGMADKAIELKKEFKEGELTAGELTMKIAEAIPVFGSFVQAGRSIHELLTGEKEEIARINEEATRTNEIAMKRGELLRMQKEAIAGVEAEYRRVEREAAAIGASPMRRENLHLDQEREETNKRLTEKRDAEIKAEKETTAGIVKELRDRANKANALLKEAQDAYQSQQETPVGLYGAETKTVAEHTAELKEALRQAQDEANTRNGELSKVINDSEAKIADLANRYKKTIAASDANVAAQALRNEITPLVDRAKEFGEEWKEGWRNFTDGAREAHAAADEALRATRAENSQFGMSDAAKRLDDFTNQTGTGRVIDALKKELSELETKKLKEEFADPVEHAAAKLKEIQNDLAVGLIKPDTARLAEDRIKLDLRSLAHDPAQDAPYRLAQQDYRRFNFGALSNPGAERLSQFQRDQLAEEKRIRAAAEALVAQPSITVNVMTGV